MDPFLDSRIASLRRISGLKSVRDDNFDQIDGSNSFLYA